MKLKYPAEAFALGIVLFSAGMKEAFAAGVLVIFCTVFAEVLKSFLEKAVPVWSLRLCVSVAAASVSASVFLTGFAALGIFLDTGVWLMTFVVGLLCARHVLRDGVEADYGQLFWESAIAWGFWIVLALAREFAAGGAVFGNQLLKLPFQSAAFEEAAFSFLAAGLALAFTNGVLKKTSKNENGLFVVIPAILLLRPFAMRSFGEAAGLIWTIAVPVILFLSVRQTLKFSCISKSYRGLPADVLSTGLIYMILSIY